MGTLKDLRGRHFGHLQVKHFAGIFHRHAYWCCICTCGEAVRVRGSRLLSGRVVSCGCARANPDIRRAARMKVPAQVRAAVASMGGTARHKRRGGVGVKCRTVEPGQRRDYGLSVDQTAEALGVSKDAVYRMMNGGVIAFRVVANGQARLSRADVEALLEQVPVDRQWKRKPDCYREGAERQGE